MPDKEETQILVTEKTYEVDKNRLYNGPRMGSE